MKKLAKTKKIMETLKKEYKMDNIVRPLGEDVTFFGSELDCYRLAYHLKNKENYVKYAPNINSFIVTFPTFFTTEFAQRITK